MSSPPNFYLPLTNAVEIFDVDYIQFVHLSLSEEVGKDISIQLLDLFQYNYNERFIRIDLIINPNFQLHDDCNRHCKELSDFMHNQGWNYRLVIMTVYLSHDVNPAAAMLDHVLAAEDGCKVADNDFDLIILEADTDTLQLISCATPASICGMQVTFTSISSFV